MTNATKAMNMAWEISREAAAKFGRKASEFIREALRLAWAIVKGEKNVKPVIIKLTHQPSGGKTWVAEIVGEDKKFKFKREFLSYVHRELSSSGRTGTVKFQLQEGKMYEINVPYRDRRFVKIVNGQEVSVEIEEVLEYVDQLKGKEEEEK